MGCRFRPCVGRQGRVAHLGCSTEISALLVCHPFPYDIGNIPQASAGMGWLKGPWRGCGTLQLKGCFGVLPDKQLIQNPSGDTWVTAEGCPACSERMGISAVLPPGDGQPVLHHNRKPRWKRPKKANPPVASQNSALVIMQGLQLSQQLVTPKHPLGALRRAEPAGSPQDTAWAEGPAPAGHPITPSRDLSH